MVGRSSSQTSPSGCRVMTQKIVHDVFQSLQQKYIFVAANSKYVALAALVRTKAVSLLLFVSDKFALHCNF